MNARFDLVVGVPINLGQYIRILNVNSLFHDKIQEIRDSGADAYIDDQMIQENIDAELEDLQETWLEDHVYTRNLKLELNTDVRSSSLVVYPFTHDVLDNPEQNDAIIGIKVGNIKFGKYPEAISLLTLRDIQINVHEEITQIKKDHPEISSLLLKSPIALYSVQENCACHETD